MQIKTEEEFFDWIEKHTSTITYVKELDKPIYLVLCGFSVKARGEDIKLSVLQYEICSVKEEFNTYVIYLLKPTSNCKKELFWIANFEHLETLKLSEDHYYIILNQSGPKVFTEQLERDNFINTWGKENFEHAKDLYLEKLIQDEIVLSENLRVNKETQRRLGYVNEYEMD